jgi:hypothetical protein
MKKKLILLIPLFIIFFLYSCNMEKEIDLKLPEYESKMVVECYLDPGNPYRLSIFESVSYFEAPALPSVDSALVIITHNGIVDTLDFIPFVDPLTNKFFNYTSSSIVPADYTSEFFLEIKDKRGRIVTGKTKIPVPVVIDNVAFSYNADSLAFALTTFTDNSASTDYYRYQITRDSYQGEEVQDFQFDDVLLQSSQVELGGPNNLEKNNFVIITLYHLNPDYFDFLESVGGAIDANGNPFGQPAIIKSNIQGGIGIFTGLGYDRITITVP